MWQAAEFLRRIGTVLRIRDEDSAHGALPERWVDLIHYLDEKERRKKSRVSGNGDGASSQTELKFQKNGPGSLGPMSHGSARGAQGFPRKRSGGRV